MDKWTIFVLSGISGGLLASTVQFLIKSPPNFPGPLLFFSALGGVAAVGVHYLLLKRTQTPSIRQGSVTGLFAGLFNISNMFLVYVVYSGSFVTTSGSFLFSAVYSGMFGGFTAAVIDRLFGE